jgi:hypothetical protein
MEATMVGSLNSLRTFEDEMRRDRVDSAARWAGAFQQHLRAHPWIWFFGRSVLSISPVTDAPGR